MSSPSDNGLPEKILDALVRIRHTDLDLSFLVVDWVEEQAYAAESLRDVPVHQDVWVFVIDVAPNPK